MGTAQAEGREVGQLLGMHCDPEVSDMAMLSTWGDQDRALQVDLGPGSWSPQPPS